MTVAATMMLNLARGIPSGVALAAVCAPASFPATRLGLVAESVVAKDWRDVLHVRV
jgi:hypothetical protein